MVPRAPPFLPASACLEPTRDNASEAMSNAANETWTDALPGLDLLHEMHFGIRDLAAMAQVAGMLGDGGAELDTLVLNRAAGALTARCRIKGLSPQRARDLLGALASAGAVEAPISVEHLMLSRGDRS
jgi:hypothetical protein